MTATLMTQQLLERLAPRAGLDQVFAELLQDHFVTEQLRRLIVDEKNIYRIRDCDPYATTDLSDAAKCEAPKAAAPC